jgi:hypothetical protein
MYQEVLPALQDQCRPWDLASVPPTSNHCSREQHRYNNKGKTFGATKSETFSAGSSFNIMLEPKLKFDQKRLTDLPA